MAASQLKTMLNGPVVAGVGATVDAGLTSDRFHVLPWDPKERVMLKIIETAEGIKLGSTKRIKPYNGDIDDILRYAEWNVANILGWGNVETEMAAAADDFKRDLRADAVAIVFLQMVYGYYADECRAAKDNEKKDIVSIAITDEMRSDIVNPTRLNRAATFVLARMHTKYQTNHAIGGTPMQASMASAVRAFYSVSPTAARSATAQAMVRAISDVIYWAVHPANETLLIPTVIQNTQIKETMVHRNGPLVELIAVEEYFQIRARTPPASTHHFYVAAAAAKQLEPLGILQYLPEPSRTQDIVSGLRMIETNGAKLHPAARFWGLDRLTANQKLVETICADLGYAVKKLMPASSLAASPILQKEDGLDTAWKGLIDALRAAMDERGKELLDEEVFKKIKAAIAPVAGTVKGIDEMKRYLLGASAARQALPPTDEGTGAEPEASGAAEHAAEEIEASSEESEEEAAGE